MTNIILISLDTTRADRLSSYGYSRCTSPHLDKIAEEGALFSDFISPHIPTFPGHTTMMTGTDIYVHQVTGQSTNPEPPPGVKMLAELLREQGYYTAAADNLGRWFARGFDYVQGYGWDTADSSAWRKGEAVLKASLDVLRRAVNQDLPFFLFFHFWDPHTPYLPPSPFSRMFYQGDEKDPSNTSMNSVWRFENFKNYFAEWMPGVTDIEFPKAQYDAEIAYMDSCIAHIASHLDSLGLKEDTCLAITADHGEELDEHGCWFDHHGLYETNIHIPLILRCPSCIPGGLRIGGLTQMMDLAPTLLELVGAKDIAHRENMRGRSLLPLIHQPYACRGTTDSVHITENTWMKKRGFRTPGWKLIVPLETPDLHGKSDVELYDLINDPGETTNAALHYPEVTKKFLSDLDTYVEARVEASGLPDPMPLQPLPLRRIGKMDTAVPRDKKLAAEEEKTPLADLKREEGDFIGYEREEEQLSGSPSIQNDSKSLRNNPDNLRER